MKKQRILALALVAAMATSVFGGMSASAVELDPDAYQKFTATAWSTATEPKDISTEYEVTKDDDGYYSIEEFENGTVYLFDLAVQSGADKDNRDAAINAIEDGEEYTTVVEAMKKYWQDSNSDSYFDMEVTDSMRNVSDTRAMALRDFEDVLDKVDDLENDIDDGLYYEDDLKAYNVKELIKDIKHYESVGYSTQATSELLNMTGAYNRIVEGGLLQAKDSWEDMYNDLLEKVEALNEDDYSADNWADVERCIRLAENDANKGTDAGYRDAYNHLMEIFDKIETKRPSYNDLRDALAELFDDNISNSELKAAMAKVKDSSTEPSELPVYTGEDDESTYVYDDYNGNKTSNEWKEFAGYDANDDGDLNDDDDVVGAYQEAVRIYALCTKSSTRKTVSQSMVDTALENLNDALLNLDPDGETANWIVVRLEEALDKANDVVEDDYRTSSTAWKDFEDAKENVEKALDNTNVSEQTAERYAKELEQAIKDLSRAKKSVPSATRNELRDVIKEAEDLLEDKTGKSVSQILALEDALEAADEINTSNTISEYEAAIADLNAAISGYNQKQGWYQENGKWYYGQGNTTVKGWLNLNGTWYYLNEDGSMATGWLNLNGTYYFLKDSGAMATGWLLNNGTWYYLQSWGGMVSNGWYWIGGSCYYFYNWGGMAVNTTIDGYTVNASGAWVR